MEKSESDTLGYFLLKNGLGDYRRAFQDKVKIIWNTQQDDLRQRCIAFSRDIDLTLSKLPSLKFYNAPYDPRGQGPILDEVSKSKNEFEHLKDLPTLFKQQNGWMSKSKLIIEDLDPEPSEPKIEEPCIDDIKTDEPVCPKRLYSAVLQGLTKTEMERKETNNSSKAVPKLESPSSIIFPKYSMCLAAPVVSVLDGSDGTSSQTNQEKQDSTDKNEEKKRNKTLTQANIKILPKVKSIDTTPAMKTQNVIREEQQNSEDLRNPNNFIFPLFAQSSYGNNYIYQFNASHYSNTYHNSCGCTNAFSHTTHVITNRNMQSFQRQSLFVPSQYQYAHPFLMLQQNRTSIYPISPMQTPYYYQPLHQTRIMQRWIVPQNSTRANLSQANYLNTHFVPQTTSLWVGPNQQQPLPSASQYFIDNRLKTKVKKTPQPQINITKSKSRINQAESSVSTETADSDHFRRVANSTSSCLDAVPSMSSQQNQPSQPKVKTDIEEVVNKTVNILFEEELPITSTVSEELEIQALEQYCNSNDNVYQELERQAAEQYDELSGNLRGPPTYDFLFGGLSRFIAYSIDVNV